MRLLVTVRASGQIRFALTLSQMAGAQILIVVYQLWHAQQHRLLNVKKDSGKTSEPW